MQYRKYSFHTGISGGTPEDQSICVCVLSCSVFSIATQFPTLDYSLACIPLFWFAEEYIRTKLTSDRHTNEYELFTHAQTSKCVVTYENTESSEHFKTMFGISFSDNDDVEDIQPDRTRTVRRNTETTTDENGQNSENAHDSNNDDFENDEPDRIVTVHRNNESTTAENVYTGPESNPDNTDGIEANGLSPTVMVERIHEGRNYDVLTLMYSRLNRNWA